MEEILHHLWLVVYPIIYRVLYIPGGAGFLPSTVDTQHFLEPIVVFHMSRLIIFCQNPPTKRCRDKLAETNRRCDAFGKIKLLGCFVRKDLTATTNSHALKVYHRAPLTEKKNDTFGLIIPMDFLGMMMKHTPQLKQLNVGKYTSPIAPSIFPTAYFLSRQLRWKTFVSWDFKSASPHHLPFLPHQRGGFTAWLTCRTV